MKVKQLLHVDINLERQVSVDRLHRLVQTHPDFVSSSVHGCIQGRSAVHVDSAQFHLRTAKEGNITIDHYEERVKKQFGDSWDMHLTFVFDDKDLKEQNFVPFTQWATEFCRRLLEKLK